MSTALSPDHDAAPRWRRVLAQADFEVRGLLRNGEQLLLTLVLPALVLVVLGGTTVVDLGPDPMDVAAPGVLALAVMSTAPDCAAATDAYRPA